jgi:hypothetical protein
LFKTDWLQPFSLRKAWKFFEQKSGAVRLWLPEKLANSVNFLASGASSAQRAAPGKWLHWQACRCLKRPIVHAGNKFFQSIENNFLNWRIDKQSTVPFFYNMQPAGLNSNNGCNRRRTASLWQKPNGPLKT